MNIESDSNTSINGEYFYIRNVQGDIIGLIDKSGTNVVSYTYDTWGKLISIEGSLKDSVGVKNPYRYRGYIYDTEIGLYYLNARYYNPYWGRFINADALIGQMGELLGHNLFMYCKNNPVNMSDPSGYRPLFDDGYGNETKEQIQVSLAIMNDRYDYDTGIIKSSLGVTGEANSVGKEYDESGNLRKERLYGPDGLAVKDKHYTDHGNPKKHPKVPHEHDWGFNENGKWAPGRWYADNSVKLNVSIGVVGGTYLIYRGIRMIPSLVPPLWWTIPANIATP